jgi:hypothetical protein
VGLLKYVWVHIFLRGPPKKKSFPAGFGKKSAGVSWRGVLDYMEEIKKCRWKKRKKGMLPSLR